MPLPAVHTKTAFPEDCEPLQNLRERRSRSDGPASFPPNRHTSRRKAHIMIRQCVFAWTVLLISHFGPLRPGFRLAGRREPTTKKCRGQGRGLRTHGAACRREVAQAASGQQDMAKKLPKEGALLGYQFQVSAAGNYEVWSRIGMRASVRRSNGESTRAPGGRSSRMIRGIDHGTWRTWVPLAWLKLGRDRPCGGQARASSSASRRGRRWRTASGCRRASSLPATRSACREGPFRPNGKFRPGKDWQNEKDKQAARQVFESRPGAGAGSSTAERIETPLGGLWQVARFDEQEVVDRTDRPTRPDAGQFFWMGTTRARQQVPGPAGAVAVPPADLPHRVRCPPSWPAGRSSSVFRR